MSWIPKMPDAPLAEGLAPWLPKALIETEWAEHVAGDMAYVVVDELHDEIAGLVLTQWPHVDGHGRLHFGLDDIGVRVATPNAQLRELLRTQRVPITPIPVSDQEDAEALADRPIAVGDVYGVRMPPRGPGGGGGGGGGGGDGETGPVPPEDLFDGPVLDLTAIARELAKTQTSAAALGVLDEAVLDAIGEELGEEEPPRPEPQGGAPTNDNSPGGAPTAPGGAGLPAEKTHASEEHARVHHHHKGIDLEDLGSHLVSDRAEVEAEDEGRGMTAGA